MIYAELAGGLGNQMFIYAFARALGLRCGEPVTLLDRQDWRDGAPAHTVCALDALNISPDVKIIADAGFAKAHLPRRNAAKALMIKYEQRRGLMARDWHSFEAAAAPLLNAVGLHFATDGYTPARRGHARDFLAWGYFQSERYFADFAPIIKEELRAKAAPAGPYAAQITAAAYPVCVHLRRGDYQKPENAILQVCTPDYYARAVAAVRDEHPDAALFVFSDDIDWAREHLDTAGLPAVFLPRGEAVADLAFMQLCRGFVLSNSTYSWWAQYLAPAPDKQTWAPDKWYAHTKKTALYQDGWQLIKTSPSGLRPQARVEAQPPEAALSAETEAAARRRLMRGSLAIRPVHGLPRHTRPSSVASRHLPPQGKAFTGGSYETHRTGHSQFC